MSRPEESKGIVSGNSFERAPLIKVSDLSQYMLCPRLVYFSARGYEQGRIVKGKERGMIEHILLKELAFNLNSIYGCVDKKGEKAREERETDAKIIIADIADDVEWIYKEELEGVREDLFVEVKEEFIRSLSKNMERDKWLSRLINGNKLLAYDYEREHTMVSEKLGMSGSVDKLIKTDEEVIPCLIKTGRRPEYGVWKSDRVQLAAYALLIEDTFETAVKRGFVEYIRAAECRELQIRKKHRALALQVLKQVKRIKKGAFPEKGAYAPCDSCSFIEMCETRKTTLLSKLLGK